MDPQQENLQEISQTPWQKHKKLIIILTTSFFLFLVSIAASLIYDQKTPQETSLGTPPANDVATLPAPKVQFASYTNASDSLTLPQTVTAYSLKTDFSEKEVREFSNKLGIFTMQKTNTDYMLGYNFSDPSYMGMLSFHSKTGNFTYESYGNINLTSRYADSNPNSVVLTFLQDLGIADTTISCPITYQRIEHPGVTFVECHRDWEKAGLPVYSFAGLLNVPTTTKLSTLTLGTVSAANPDDTSIVNVNAGTDPQATGKARPNDFNTVTVALKEDGRLVRVDSTMRIITTSSKVQASEIYSQKEALEQFYAHKSQLLLTLPLGSGTVDWQKVYQNNTASAKTATITDITLSYLEKPAFEKQSALVPMYTIRGVARLDNGYSVSFVETLPALKNKTSFIAQNDEKSFRLIRKALAQTPGEQLQLQPFYPTTVPSNTPAPQPEIPLTPTATPTRGPTKTPTPTRPPAATPTPRPQPRCVPTSANVITLQVPEYGSLTVQTGGSQYTSHKFYVTSASFPTSDMTAVRDAFFKAVEEQFIINVAQAPQTQSAIIADVNAAKSLFRQINNFPMLQSCNIADQSITNTAPIFKCGTGQTSAGPNTRWDPHADSVADNVAAKAVELKKNGTLQSYASKPDLFPAVTLSDFHRIFITSTNELDSISCYVTGQSPALFLYTQQPTSVTVSLPSFTTFTQPAAPSHVWSVNVNTSGVLSNAFSPLPLPYLYYEYDGAKLSFTEQKEGYIVMYDNWKDTVAKISSAVKLNKTETERLEQEVQNVLVGKPKSKYLKLSVVSQNEIDQKLPLNIAPKPDTLYRLHILISPEERLETLKQPIIAPLTRSGSITVEVGAIYK